MGMGCVGCVVGVGRVVGAVGARIHLKKSFLKVFLQMIRQTQQQLGHKQSQDKG